MNFLDAINQAGEPTMKSTTGATVLANNPSSDFALFELIQDPKNLNNFSPYYLGWDRSGNTGTGGVVIHHPEGDVKKIATYNITPGNSDCHTPGSNYWMLHFQPTPHGWSVTESGSSGSPLISANKKVIGQLRGFGTCPNPNCSDSEEDISSYGKFSISWTGDTSDYRRRLNYWLDPLGTNPSVQDGRGFPSYSGSNIVCSWGTAISLIDLPPNSTIQWLSGSNLARVSSQGSNPCTFSSTGNGASWVSATVNLSGGGSITLPQFKVWSGVPIFTSISGPNPPYIYKGCTGVGYTFWANPMRDTDSQSSYTWMVEPAYLNWYFQYQYNDWVTIVFNDPSDYYQVITRASNTCGQTNWLYKSVEIMDCYYFSIYPNPASDFVTITASLPDIDTDFKLPSDYKIQITDNAGIINYSSTKSGDSFTIPVNNLKDGSYIVTITFGDKIESLPLIIKR